MKKQKYKRIQKIILSSLFFLFPTLLLSQKYEINDILSNDKEVKEYTFNLILSDLLMNSSAMSNNEYCSLLENIPELFFIDTITSQKIKEICFIKATPVSRDSISNFYEKMENENHIYTFRKQSITGNQSFLYPNSDYYYAVNGAIIYKLFGFVKLDYELFFKDCLNEGLFIDIDREKKTTKRKLKKALTSIHVGIIDFWLEYKKNMN
ncbi:MAG: hypothetical protein KFKLKKLM_01612 [Flavobacteriales bacterium]|nr:hypothetical protein [Flavobacteriales bacterium]